MPSEPGPRRVAFLAHCLLNQNAKVDEGAKTPAMWQPVVELLRERGYVIRQMPCPELAFGGARRFWGVREQYDTPLYRRHCRRLAKLVAAVMGQHVEAGDDVVLIGIDSSPTMGVNFTPSAPHWGGRPDRVEDDSTLIKGDGIFIEELSAELELRGLPVPRSTGIRHWVPRLRPGRRATPPRAATGQPTRMKGDVRGYQVAVVADSLLDRLLPVLEEKRWGVIQLPPNGLDEETTAAWLEQVEEHVAEFRRNEYALVVLDDGSHELGLQAPLFQATGGLDEVREFLGQYAIQPPSTSRLNPET